MNRDDFLMLNRDIIYFDNGATTLKPKCLVDGISDYYNNYSANAHRGDYDISLKVDMMYEHTRDLVRDLIGACDSSEIVFTSGTTDSLNKIIFGYFRDKLVSGDEVILTRAEHASNVLPWFELKDELDLKLSYISLNDDYEVTLDSVKESITDKTRVISIAHISNVVGDIRPIKDIINYAHSKGIIVIVDGAQSVPHVPIDVVDMDIDFLAFSLHKMCGPTGVGILYGKKELLSNIKPLIYGGGMNASFSDDGVRVYKELPHLLEAGTPNIADVIASGKVIEYLNNIGFDKISSYEYDLKRYAVKKLSMNPNIIIYNKNSKSGIVTFNYKDIFSQDLAIYLNKYNICVRAGNHCAKILKEELKVKNTCRISFYFYNTYDEIDRLCDVLNNPNIKNEIIG